MSLDLVKVTLLNGNEPKCVGNRITTVIHGTSQEGSSEKCYSQEKEQILAGSKSVWNIKELGKSCRKFLYDPDKEIKVQVRTYATAKGNGFCPIKVELEILDIVSNTPRYFCSEMTKKESFKRNNDKKYVAKEESCLLN